MVWSQMTQIKHLDSNSLHAISHKYSGNFSISWKTSDALRQTESNLWQMPLWTRMETRMETRMTFWSRCGLIHISRQQELAVSRFDEVFFKQTSLTYFKSVLLNYTLISDTDRTIAAEHGHTRAAGNFKYEVYCTHIW